MLPLTSLCTIPLACKNFKAFNTSSKYQRLSICEMTGQGASLFISLDFISSIRSLMVPPKDHN